MSLAKFAALLLAAALAGCLPMGDRVAGSSTEAGNAGGKLSLADGRPAADVEVALVAREFRADTAADPAPDDVPGAYYRTRTDADGRYAFAGVIPGDYRVMALAAGLGATVDSLSVGPGGDTAFVARVLKPLGGIRGVAKVEGGSARMHVWVGCKATLKRNRLADSAGLFRLDSLPEGEYDLQSFCAACQDQVKPMRVRVAAGRDTLLSDTLKLYPGYLQAFPAADGFTVRPADLPFFIGGKTQRGEEDHVNPTLAIWTWDGKAVTGKDNPATDSAGIRETQIRIDSTFFREQAAGILGLELRYPDTTVIRAWRIAYDSEPWTYALRWVRAEPVGKLIGGDHPVWQFRILEAFAPDPLDLAYFGLVPADSGRIPAGEVELALETKDQVMVEGTGPQELTFLLIPDQRAGGRVIRPRRDESLADIPAMRLWDAARLGGLGSADSLDPHLLPEGLQIDRHRAGGARQRYLFSRNGKITEMLKLPYAWTASAPPSSGTDAFDPDSLTLFYRRAPAGSSFSWDAPLRGAARAWAVDTRGRAWELDTGKVVGPRILPAALAAELASLLAPMAGDPPALADTAAIPPGRPLAYAWYSGRGRLGDADADPLLAALADWLGRTGLTGVRGFALPDSLPFRFLSFRAETSGLRYTGDTLVLQRDPGAPDRFNEYLTPGSPGRSSDSAVWTYTLRIEGDSLVAGADDGFTSRLFGKIGARTPLFALAGLVPVITGEQFGLPTLESGGKGLAGIWDGPHDLGNRVMTAPAVKLVAKPQVNGGRDAGYLYTAQGGLEREWKIAVNQTWAEGWDKVTGKEDKEGFYDDTAQHP
jgi:hypothetical protein